MSLFYDWSAHSFVDLCNVPKNTFIFHTGLVFVISIFIYLQIYLSTYARVRIISFLGVNAGKTFLKFKKSTEIKPNLDCSYTYTIDLAQNWMPFGGKSNCDYRCNQKKSVITIQIWFDLASFLRRIHCPKQTCQGARSAAPRFSRRKRLQIQNVLYISYQIKYCIKYL